MVEDIIYYINSKALTRVSFLTGHGSNKISNPILPKVKMNELKSQQGGEIFQYKI